MFLAFPLYVLHAVLTGLSLVVMNLLQVKLGFTFSAGLFDYLLSYGLGTNGWKLIPVGLTYGVLYYFVFYYAITKWNLLTPGREPQAVLAPNTPEPTVPAPEQTHMDEPLARGEKYIQALGGKDNILSLDACATRLRLEVKNATEVQENALKQLGARGVVNGGNGIVQVVIGPEADLLADEIKQYLK